MPVTSLRKTCVRPSEVAKIKSKIKIKIKIKIKSQSEKPADFKVAGFPNHRISHSVLSEEQLLKA